MNSVDFPDKRQVFHTRLHSVNANMLFLIDLHLVCPDPAAW